MDLSTSYLGFRLEHPLMVGASPMVHDLGAVRRLEDAGASAFVMSSLFEEQVLREAWGTHLDLHAHANAHAEARSYLPEPTTFAFGPDAYLEYVQKLKDMVGVPVFASLNGTTPGGWTLYAMLMEEAGADALELNPYQVATDPLRSGEEMEDELVELVRAVCREVTIPVAVKLTPHVTSLPHLARRLKGAGASGVVLFNRFLQADFDLENLEMVPRLRLSDPSELLQRLHGLAVLHGRVELDLACSGGVHTVEDALKAVFAGAGAVQMVSALLQRGPQALVRLQAGMRDWLERHEYESLAQGQGSLSLAKVSNPHAFHRAHYMRVLQGWRPEAAGRI
jgi:dihydroorotate dehydrogenase (fumarate)